MSFTLANDVKSFTEQCVAHFESVFFSYPLGSWLTAKLPSYLADHAHARQGHEEGKGTNGYVAKSFPI